MTQQWEMYLLARFPRPVAILLIMGGWTLMVAAFMSLLMIALFALILAGINLGFETSAVLVCVVCFIWFLAYAYFQVDKNLPHREKGKDK